MENLFEYEGIEEKDKVKIKKSRLKVHIFCAQNVSKKIDERRIDPKITSWYIMIDKMKEKKIPRDYRVQLYKKMRNFRKKNMDVIEIHRGIPQA